MKKDSKTLVIYVPGDVLPDKPLAERVRYVIAIGYVPLESEPTPAAYAFADRFKIVSSSVRNSPLGPDHRVVISGPPDDINAYARRLRELE